MTGTLRLRDGETTLLGGLIQKQESDALRGALGASKVPIIGRLLSGTRKVDDDLEILMSITPHLVRAPKVTARDLTSLAIGTRELIRVPSVRPPLFGDVEDPGPAPGPGARPAGPPVVPVTPPEGAGLTLPPSEYHGGSACAGCSRPPGDTRRDAAGGLAQLSPSELRVAPGATTSAGIVVMGVQDLTGVELVVAWDPRLLEATEVAPGALLTLDGQAGGCGTRVGIGTNPGPLHAGRGDVGIGSGGGDDVPGVGAGHRTDRDRAARPDHGGRADGRAHRGRRGDGDPVKVPFAMPSRLAALLLTGAAAACAGALFTAPPGSSLTLQANPGFVASHGGATGRSIVTALVHRARGHAGVRRHGRDVLHDPRHDRFPGQDAQRRGPGQLRLGQPLGHGGDHRGVGWTGSHPHGQRVAGHGRRCRGIRRPAPPPPKSSSATCRSSPRPRSRSGPIRHGSPSRTPPTSSPAWWTSAGIPVAQVPVRFEVVPDPACVGSSSSTARPRLHEQHGEAERVCAHGDRTVATRRWWSRSRAGRVHPVDAPLPIPILVKRAKPIPLLVSSRFSRPWRARPRGDRRAGERTTLKVAAHRLEAGQIVADAEGRRGGRRCPPPAVRGLVPDEVLEEMGRPSAHRAVTCVRWPPSRRGGTGSTPSWCWPWWPWSRPSNPQAVSRKGARGLMQPCPPRRAKRRERRLRPRENLDGGTRYLKDLIAPYDGDVTKALAAYNAGPGAVPRYGGVPPYKETRRYVRGVLRRQAQRRGPPTGRR